MSSTWTQYPISGSPPRFLNPWPPSHYLRAMQITPNPFSDLLIVQMDSNVDFPIDVRIETLSGALVFNTRISTYKTVFETSNYPNGPLRITAQKGKSIFFSEIFIHQ